jgi:hypothetical protein
MSTPCPTSWRHHVVERTAVLAVYAARLPRWIPVVVVVALVVGGLAVRGAAGFVLVAALLAVQAWLILLHWDVLTAPARLVRLLIAAGFVALAISKLA